MTSTELKAACLAVALVAATGAWAQTAAPAGGGNGMPAAGSPAGAPASGSTDSPKTAPVKPGQTLSNGPNSATGVSGSGNAGAGGGVAPGQQ